MFKITLGKGFNVTFENGYSVSVQWGPSNYCDNYAERFAPESTNERCGKHGSSTAETAVIYKRKLIEVPLWPGDTVQGRMTPAQVLTLMVWAAQQKGEE